VRPMYFKQGVSCDERGAPTEGRAYNS
jgi:hypothetical protein